MSQEQVKCKTRVANHGEVFTADREVNAMLDLVKHDGADRVSVSGAGLRYGKLSGGSTAPEVESRQAPGQKKSVGL